MVAPMPNHPPVLAGAPPAPISIGPDTYLLRHVRQVPGDCLWACANSMVITGTEPVLVAATPVADRVEWLEGVFDIVEPDDVRWLILAHDDLPVTTGVAGLLAAFPQAVVVTRRPALHHVPDASALPLGRCRWVGDGETIDAGDRRLLALRAPVWSVSGNRSLLDQRTGIYWATDSFGCLLPAEPVGTVAELDGEAWAEGMATFARDLLAPWLDLVDHQRFAALCDRTQALGMTTIATAHSPLIADASIDDAFRLLRDLPATGGAPRPGQRTPRRAGLTSTTHQISESGQNR
jgi:flavorubredoxin